MASACLALLACGEEFVATGGTGGAALVASASSTSAGPGGAGGAISSGPAIGGAGGQGGQGGQGGAEAAACDPDEKASKADGLFVDAAVNGAGEGSPEAPFSSLGKAIKAASASTAKRIFVASGVYPGTLELGGGASGISIVGGWIRKPGVWTRDCAEGSRDKVRIEGEGIGARIVDAEDVRLSTLTVVAKDAVGHTEEGDGKSVYGIFVSGAKARLDLEDVAILAGDATGGAPLEAPAQAGNRACDGRIDCSATPLVGEPGGDAAPTTAGDGFSASGYVPRPGAAGGKGGEGDNGEAGTAASVACVACGASCEFCVATPNPTTGLAGTCGCGGLGGTGGRAGRGGGASVALFATSGARVLVASGALRAGAGGDGSPGTSGALGGSGTEGQAGELVACHTSCQEVNNPNGTCSCTGTNLQSEQGAKGTSGLPGGAGGKGSGGTGGASFVVVQIAGAQVDMKPFVSLLPGEPGAGAEGSADGTSGGVY